MKRTLPVLLLLMAFTFGFLNQASAQATAVSLSVTDHGTAFSLMQQTASGFFAIRLSDIKPYQPAATPMAVFPLLYLAAETNQPPAVIWRGKSSYGWGRTAKEMGLPANYHGKYMSRKHRQKYHSSYQMNNPDFEEASTVHFLCDYYDTNPEFIFYWRSKGLSFEDLFVGINLGAHLGQPPRDFFQLRLAGRDWRFITAKYRVPYEILSKPVPPARGKPVKVEKEKFKNESQEYPWPNKDPGPDGKKHGKKW